MIKNHYHRKSKGFYIKMYFIEWYGPKKKFDEANFDGIISKLDFLKRWQKYNIFQEIAFLIQNRTFNRHRWIGPVD